MKTLFTLIFLAITTFTFAQSQANDYQMLTVSTETIDISDLEKQGSNVVIRETQGSRIIVETYVQSNCTQKANKVVLSWTKPKLVGNKLTPTNGTKYLEYVNGIQANTNYTVYLPKGVTVQ